MRLNLPFFIARRYLFSKKSTNAINVISIISMVGVAVATMALVKPCRPLAADGSS